MKACEIFQNMSAALAAKIVTFLRTEHKPVYRATLEALGQQRKLRLVFLTQKSRDEQDKFMVDNLKKPLSEVITQQILQVWLMKGCSPMLAAFLDHLGIDHDGKGAVEGELPGSFDAGKLKAALELITDKYPAEEAAVYIRVFQLQQPDGWKEVADAIDSMGDRLKLG